MSRISEYLSVPMILILLGAILSAIGAFVATYRQNEDKVQSASQRAQFETELRKKSEEITALNKTIAASVTGGDSFCYVEFIVGSDRITPTITSHGKYPVYDVNIQMRDEDEKDESVAPIRLNIGTMSAQQQQTANRTLPLPSNKDALRFKILINARNGWFTEILRLHRVNGKWKTAMKITKDPLPDDDANAPPTVLLEWVDPEFPRGQDAQVEW